MQRCLAPPFGEAAGGLVSPQEGEERVTGGLANPLVVPTNAVGKVGPRSVLAAEEDAAGDRIVAEAQRSDVEHGDIHRELERPAQIFREGRLVLQRGSSGKATIIEVDRDVDVAESVSVDERAVEIGKEDLLAERQKVMEGRGDASLLTRCQSIPAVHGFAPQNQ